MKDIDRKWGASEVNVMMAREAAKWNAVGGTDQAKNQKSFHMQGEGFLRA